LRDIVQSDVNDPLNACFAQNGEELFGRFSGKADGKKLHSSHAASPVDSTSPEAPSFLV
jgi:hypothetical protein